MGPIPPFPLRKLHEKVTLWPFFFKLPHVRAFSREFLRAFERRSRAISVPTAAQTRPRAALTPCVLRSTHIARLPSFAWAMRRKSNKFCHTFARFLTNFCAKSRNLGANCSADSAASRADTVRVALHTRCSLAEFCVGGAP